MQPRLTRISGEAMGSLFEIYLAGEDAEALERIGREGLGLAQSLERRLSHYNPHSEISCLNALAPHAPAPVSPDLFALLLRLRDLSAETEGAFDCTAGKLVQEWGLFRKGTLQGKTVAAPENETLQRIVQEIGWKAVELNEQERTVRFLSASVVLHLGAAGKGYIVDRVSEHLRAQGIACALTHSGFSSIVAIGSPPDSEGWVLGVSHPRHGSETAAHVILKNAALSTSGSAESATTFEGRRICHIFDPRTGSPVAFEGSVSAISPDALTGDALTTAFFVQGTDWAQNYCLRHSGIEALFLRVAEDGAVQATASEMQSRRFRL